MCDERERLIGYVYDECDAGERQTIDTHLTQCADCRDEIQALRRVRADLLAWNVPGAPDVWRPFAPEAPRAWWSQVPAWAMASAAGLMLMAGLAGGVTARAFVPQAAPVIVEAPMRSGVAAAVPAADLAAIQASLLDLVRAELEQRAQPTAERPASVRLASTSVDDGALRRVDELSRDSSEMLEAVSLLYEQNLADRSGIDQRLKLLQQQVDQLMTLVMTAGTQSPGDPR